MILFCKLVDLFSHITHSGSLEYHVKDVYLSITLQL
jgi:hypothetical protein